MNLPYYHEATCLRNKGPFYTFTLKYDLPQYCELKVLGQFRGICSISFAKFFPRFNEITWKFDLLLLSGPNVFAKRKAFLLMQLENPTFPTITSKKVKKHKVVFLKRFELHQLSRAEIFSKVSQFWWYHLTIDLTLSQAEIFAKIP